MTLIDPTTVEHRPRFHFTPDRNWMNDPNGLVFFEGEYHLFFQYNPHGMNWGHMSWGHAVSTDLVHWEELAIAMPEREFMIFSGSVVVDWQNSSGLGDGAAPPLVALYTAYRQGLERQSQHLGYSHDRGRSWIEHPGNPVIDLDLEHFRDPKVFWHAPSKAWVLVVALARAHKVQIYRSANLIAWELASEFGPAGSTSGQWECPDLIEVPIEGEAATAWALKVDVDKDFVCGGSGAQLFAGSFDGFVFTPQPGPVQTVDVGPDFYAAQSWSDLPEAAEGPLWLGWMSNHLTGKDYPTHPWRGAMTVPRQLRFRRVGQALHLVQQPARLVREGLPVLAVESVLDGGQALSLYRDGQAFSGTVAFTIRQGSRGLLLFRIAGEEGSGIEVGFDLERREMALRRLPHPALPGETFAAASRSPIPAGADVPVEILVDRSSVEVFVGDGASVLTACYFAIGTPHADLIAGEGSFILLGTAGSEDAAISASR